jgi:hypothetical protein
MKSPGPYLASGDLAKCGKKILRDAPQVGKVTPASAGNENLLSDPLRPFEYRHAPPTLACLDGAHQSRRARAQHYYIEALLVLWQNSW